MQDNRMICHRFIASSDHLCTQVLRRFTDFYNLT